MNGRPADAVAGHWVDRFAPPRWRPYLRLARIDRPVGWWLLLLPCWWSAALAAIAADRPWPDPWHCLLFLVGAIAMRGAGSTYNDIADRDLDAQVERTRLRPLPSGQVRPRHAAVFLVLQALIGLGVLLQFNADAVLVGVCSLLPVAIYPFMKRVMSLPQLVLGLAFAWGALMGWVAVFDRLDAPALLLYAGALSWVIGYDTIYAVQDIEDDEIAGIRSSARLFRGACAARRRPLLRGSPRSSWHSPPTRPGRASSGISASRPSPCILDGRSSSCGSATGAGRSNCSDRTGMRD